MEWISIKDFVPPESTDVLVCSVEGVEIAWWSPSHQECFTPEGKSTWAPVTHWMPLPEPPN